MRAALCSLVLLAIAGVALGGLNTCSPDGTFFPTGYENRNYPEVFSLDNQVAGGYSGTGAPLRVAVSGANDKPISIYFAPQWMLLSKGAVDSKCNSAMASLTGASSARKLHQSSSYTVTKAAQYMFSWNLNDETETVVGKFPGDAAVPPMVTVPIALRPDGEYCLFVHAKVLAGTASVTSGANTLNLPLEDQKITKYFCFKKVTDRITASLSFDTCKKNFTVIATNISAVPYMSTPSLQLYSVVVYVFGNTSRELDPERRLDYIDAYMDWYDPMKPARISWTSDNLKDGLYEIRARTFIRSNVPSLVNVSGLQPAPSNAYSDDSNLYLGWVLNNDKPYKVNVVNQPTKIGDVDCEFDVGSSNRITMNWTPTGKGTMTCKVDGKSGNNIRDAVTGSLKGCDAPWQYDLKDTANHTLEIFFNDVCGNTVRKELQFGMWGCQVNITAEPPEPPSPASPAPAPADTLYSEVPSSGGLTLGGLNASGLAALSGGSSKSAAAAVFSPFQQLGLLALCAVLALWVHWDELQ